MITFIKRLAVLLLIQVTTVNFVFADGGENNNLTTFYNSFLPNFQKLTPEASALGQYGKYSISGYTGVPDISVPLFTIGSGSFSMPVELKYDASGIKVEQEATYVGLGWNLMMGGSISHIVCGQNDFTEEKYTGEKKSNLDLPQYLFPNLYLSQPIAKTLTVKFKGSSSLFGEETSFSPEEAHRVNYDILRDVVKGSRVPDIFQASFCGHNVSFVIDKSTKTAKIINCDATSYKIELKDYNTYPRLIEITDDHGLHYVFTLYQETSKEDNRVYHLSSIKNNSECFIEFKYTQYGGYLLKSPYYETIGKKDKNHISQQEPPQTIQGMFINRKFPDFSSFFHGISVYYPDTIKTKREIVTFTYGDRTDIIGAKRIKGIIVRSRTDNSTIHNVVFEYGDFIESNIDEDICYYGSNYSKTRLKLTNVIIDGKKYSFEYINDNSLPTRLSKSQDFWGYYNGQKNEKGFCASPECKYNAQGTIDGLETVGPANRYASEEHCGIGTLNKITYPTGGYTKFYYEVHHFDDINGKFYYPQSTTFNSSVKYIRTEACGSGYNGKGYSTTPDTREFDVDQPTKVEIASNTPYYPNNQQYYRIDFTITGKESNGKVFPSRSYTKYNHNQDFKDSILLPKGHYVLSSQFITVANKLIIWGRIVVSFPPQYKEDKSIEDASGKSIGGGLRIRSIENYDSDKKLVNSTLYKYEGGKLLIPTVKNELITMEYSTKKESYSPREGHTNWYVPDTYRFFFVTSTPAYPEICSLGISNVGYSKITKENYDKDHKLLSYNIEIYNNKAYGQVDIGDVNYNMFQVNMDGLNGKLEESTTYSNEGVIMHNVLHSYKTLISGSDVVYFPWSRALTMHPSLYGYANYKCSLYPKRSICVLPERIIETNYVNGTAMKPVTTTFEYNANNYQPANVTKSVTLNSQTSDVVTTRYWYPNDSEVSSSNPSYLTKANCVSEKVKAVEYRNGKTVGGYRNVYGSLSNGLPIIKKNYSITSSNSEILELDVTYYDNYGNIREYKKKDGTPVTIIWSYNHQHPIMEIVGKTYDQVKTAYSSITSLEDKPSVAETTMSSIHATLRKNLPDALVTAYTYSPWHTVSEIIQPNGNKTKYAYDSYGRLEETKDINDKILQKYTYNYKEENK